MSETYAPPEPYERTASTEGEDAVPSFSARLRAQTQDVHREAERTGFIADLLRGRADRGGYATFLRNLVPVYAALETALDAHLATPIIAAFAHSRFRRLDALTGDVAHLEREDGPSALPISAEAHAYADAIANAARTNPLGLVAHAYARYLGDLSGGQILGPWLARTLSLDPAALTFYDFPAIADLNAAKRDMRDVLDAIPARDAAADLIISEAVGAFRHNIAVSKAVQSMLQ